MATEVVSIHTVVRGTAKGREEIKPKHRFYSEGKELESLLAAKAVRKATPGDAALPLIGKAEAAEPEAPAKKAPAKKSPAKKSPAEKAPAEGDSDEGLV